MTAADAFLDHLYRSEPVTATFVGVHDHDDRLPDWSPGGLEALDAGLAALGTSLAADGALDSALMASSVDVRRAELASGHGVRGNPSLWTGEAIFGVIALMVRDFAPLAERVANAGGRLRRVPTFLADAILALGDRPIPAAWTARALRECEGADVLLDRGVPRWAPELADDARRARAAFADFAAWLRARPAAGDGALACGGELYDLLLRRGHWCDRPRAELLASARDALGAERARLDALCAAEGGSWEAMRARLAADVPAPDAYLAEFARAWEASRAAAERVVPWPDWPIRYGPIPEVTRDAAPYLYYLFYRSPAPLDPYGVHDYVVSPGWDRTTIVLNHVIHHGGVGHHVQNWHAYHRAPTRVGRVAAVDAASRIAMFQGGTMAEGWACYATVLMEELGFLTPPQRVSEQHSRVRFAARAVIDIELHQGTMSFDEAVRFWAEHTMTSADVGRAEVTKASMFPGTAIMYWLGTSTILSLRETLQARPGFTLRGFHEALLGHGSIPVPLIAQLMLGRDA